MVRQRAVTLAMEPRKPDEEHSMTAYALFDNLEINDLGKFEQYKSRVPPIVQRYGGRYVVLGGKVELVEGVWRPRFPVMLEFPTLRRAQDWYASDEYRDLRALRLSAGSFNAVFIEGMP
jgi:uncharacterized protein (DUF1330 family)